MTRASLRRDARLLCKIPRLGLPALQAWCRFQGGNTLDEPEGGAKVAASCAVR